MEERGLENGDYFENIDDDDPDAIRIANEFMELKLPHDYFEGYINRIAKISTGLGYQSTMFIPIIDNEGYYLERQLALFGNREQTDVDVEKYKMWRMRDDER